MESRVSPLLRPYLSLLMIAPYDSHLNLDELSAMVKEINETQVAPEERLTGRSYIITLWERKINERIVNRPGDLQ